MIFCTVAKCQYALNADRIPKGNLPRLLDALHVR